MHPFNPRTAIFLLAACSGLSAAHAENERAVARTIYQRIAGRPPTNATLQRLAGFARNEEYSEIAKVAMTDDEFYRITLANWAKRKTNPSNSIDTPLNDSAALIVGLVANDEPFHQVLFGDVIYTSDDNFANLTNTLTTPASTVFAPFSVDSNTHFEQLEAAAEAGRPAAWHRRLVKAPQVGTGNGKYGALVPIPAEDVGGIQTTRAWAKAYMNAGTNRRMFNALMGQWMCSTLEQIHYTGAPDDRVRQDVERCPGGKCSDFKTTCVGCHATMDSAAGAFAYLDVDQAAVEGIDRIRHKAMANGALDPLQSPNSVQGKNTRAEVEANRRTGFVTRDNSWKNYLLLGPNSRFFEGSVGVPRSGQGVQSFSKTFAESFGFARCMADQWFEITCSRQATEVEKTRLAQAARNFMAETRYNLKSLISEVTNVCYRD